MKSIIYKDQDGFKERRIVKNGDTSSKAEFGIPDGPPDLRQLDIESLLKEVNNNLVDNELFTWDDVQRFPGGINAAVNIFRRKIIELYREEYRNRKKGV